MSILSLQCFSKITKSLKPVSDAFKMKANITTTGYNNLVVSVNRKVMLVGINRPSVRNCVNIETGKELLNAMEEFDSDSSVSVAVLHGVGGNFCAGFDLKELSQQNKDTLKLIPTNHGPMGPSRMMLSKPVISAVSGYAVAGGMELALWTDLRVMEDTAVMGVFCRRFGVPLVDGGAVRLQALIGLSRALDLILTGRAIKAAEAYSWGLANRVVPEGQGLSSAIELAETIAGFPQECMRADRLLAYKAAYSNNLGELLQLEFTNAVHVLAKESISGAQSFVSGTGRHGIFKDEKSKSKL